MQAAERAAVQRERQARKRRRGWLAVLLVLGGLLVFISVAMLTAWLGQGWLTYPGGAAKPIILLIETVATLSIAASLSLLVVGEGEDAPS